MDQTNYNDSQLFEIKIKDLHYILKNLDLEEESLKHFLNTSQYKDLLNLGYLTHHQKDNILSDAIEKSGRSANFVNGMLTGVIGGWMGMYDFLRIKIESQLQFVFVVSTAFFLSSIVGFLSYRSVSEENKHEIKKQKLKNIQLKVINMLIIKRVSSIRKTICRYNKMLKACNEKNELCLNYRFINEDAVEKAMRRLVIFFNKKINRIKLLDIEVKDKLKIYLSPTLKKLSHHKEENQKNRYPEYLRILSEPELRPPEAPKTVYRWLLKNKKRVAVNLFPALLGSFGSTFVFLVGMPNIFDKLGYKRIAGIFDEPLSAGIGVSLALILTVYLSYFSIKSLYRAYKRGKCIEDSEKKILELEQDFIKTNHLHRKVSRLLDELKKISLILCLIKNIHEVDRSQFKKNSHTLE